MRSQNRNPTISRIKIPFSLRSLLGDHTADKEPKYNNKYNNQRYGRKQLTKSPNDIGFEFDKEFAGLLNSGDMLTSGQSKLVPEDS